MAEVVLRDGVGGFQCPSKLHQHAPKLPQISMIFFFFFFWLYHETCGILVLPPGIELRPSESTEV